MLLYPPIKDLLVNMVASRARKLSSQSETSGEPLEEKAVSLAIREVADGTLTLESVQAQTPEEESAGADGNEEI